MGIGCRAAAVPTAGIGAPLRRLRAAACALAVFVISTVLALPGPAAAAAADLRVTRIDARGEDSILLSGGLVAFHGGEVDWYDHDRPAPEALAALLPELLAGRWHTAPQDAGAAWPDAVVRAFALWPTVTGGIGIPRPGSPPFMHNMALATLDPQRHRYLSLLLPVQPSNDAFVGNEDPRRYRLFDDDGRFLGPFFIDVYGPDVADAGLCDNTETGLRWLDLPTGSLQPCIGGEGTVRAHPGLNGSLRNPDGRPIGVLGATSTAPWMVPTYFDPIAADFSRPGQRLGRLLVASSTSWFGASGAWYNPQRAGEGFSLQVLPPAVAGGPSRALVYWYTYRADGSGRPFWLTGVGDITSYTLPRLTVALHRTQGGRFASTGNAQTVTATPWGTLTIAFTACDRASIQYQSTDEAFGGGSFELRRLGPPVEGLDWLCVGDPFDNPPPP
jgi:hypothetical protein